MTVLSDLEVESLVPEGSSDELFDQVTTLIDQVEGELEEYLGRPIQVTETLGEVHELGYDETRLYLKNTPVVSIEAVRANGVTFTVPTWQQTRWGLDMGATTALAMLDPVVWTPSAWAFSSAPPDVYALASGTIPRTQYSIDYHGGLDGPNIRGIRSLVSKAVRRELASQAEGMFGQGDYTRIAVEDYTIQKNERLMLQKVGSFTAGELRIVERLRNKGKVAV